MKNSVNWVDIPVHNLDRAITFYQTVMAVELQVPMGMPAGFKMAVLPFDMGNGGVGAALVEGPGYEPGHHGPLIYLNGGEDLSIPLSKVEQAGGKVVQPKTSIGPNGFMAQFLDTEGNKMALHSMK